jgi:hypothetical protein
MALLFRPETSIATGLFSTFFIPPLSILGMAKGAGFYVGAGAFVAAAAVVALVIFLLTAAVQNWRSDRRRAWLMLLPVLAGYTLWYSMIFGIWG